METQIGYTPEAFYCDLRVTWTWHCDEASPAELMADILYVPESSGKTSLINKLHLSP